MKSLITSIADINLVDEDGSCLLIKAVQSKQIEIVNFILEKKVNIDQADDSQSTALHYACKSKNLEIVKLLVNAGAKVEFLNNENLTPFSEACKQSQIGIMKIFLDAGWDINCVDIYHRTHLINSIRRENDSTFVINPFTAGNFATTNFLLEHGADISKVDKDGMTALMWAAKTNNEKVFDLLLDLKPEVNCVDLKQTTALAHAVMSLNVQMVAKLIQAGADVNIASNCQVKCNKKFNVCNTVEYLKEIQEKVTQPSNGKNTPLHIAISVCWGRSNNTIIDLLLKSGANVNDADENGRTPLHLAAITGDHALVEALVRRGAKINNVDNFGMFPLHISILYKYHKLTQCLIEDYRGLFYLNRDALSSSLYLAILNDDTSLVESLFKHGARIKKGSGAELLISLEHANYDVTLDLLEHGADANVKDSNGIPALLKAIRIANPDSSVTRANAFGLNRLASLSGNGLMLKHNYAKWYTCSFDLFNSFLDNGANVSATDNKGNTCLHAAAKFCGNSNLQLFVAYEAEVNVQNAKGETPLMKACRRGNVEAVRYLLSVGADVMLVNENRDTALHHAVISARRENHVKMVVSTTNAYVKSKTSDIVEMLVGLGINIHARNREGNTALHLAVKYDVCLLTILLINLGSNVNEQNNDGDTPLFFLKNHKVISYLLDAKADINIRNNRGETALHRVYDVEIARALLDRGAEMIISTEGQTALMYAATSDNFELVQLLIERGANINVQDNEGRNCLMKALRRYRQFNYDILKFLIMSGADVNASDKTGQTACMLAVINDCFVIVTTLRMFGADLNKVDKENRSALVHVLLNNRIDRMSYIMEVLKLGADIVVDSQYRYLVQSVTKEFEDATITSVRSPRIFQFFVLNGCILNQTKESTKRNETSMFYHPINKISLKNLDFIKYIFAIGMIFKSDLQLLRKLGKDCSMYPDFRKHILAVLKPALQEPWPLVKLAFIEVSTLIGTGPMREEKLKQTKLPPRLQRTLMFQEPISRLPVEDWSKIPLCFDPVQYETLPCPRPLLYYWPVGHKLVI
ncbi:putative ankyrin repeat protein RF_0381 [Physella acuta]|uniref:putative ankyrin repeat protein RF_0381 n=1 Tax=Physella acuta TaxID=109671 RepID=UPI0027DB8159|nr:putative ankyrin repeat protein RF_0381 [Physella acuta]